jgi:secondary thiamine-phosphate synthase enzyme
LRDGKQVKYGWSSEWTVAVVTRTLQVASAGENDVIDLTEGVRKAVKEAGLGSGIVTVFVSGSTGAVTTMECEPGLVKDFPRMLERVSPKSISYEHHKTWNDDNGRSHVKASLIGPSVTVPFVGGELMLGTWQQVVFIELDTRPRRRDIVIQILGE